MQLFEAGSLHVFIHLCQKKPKSGPNFPDLHQVAQSSGPDKALRQRKTTMCFEKSTEYRSCFFLLKQIISTEMRFFSY